MILLLCFSCPFDYVKIYDGYTNQAEVIGIYCGRHKNLELFSTTESLHIEFVTKSGRVEPTKKPYVPYWEIEEDSKILMKGFKADFEISSGFVNLGKSYVSVVYHVYHCLVFQLPEQHMPGLYKNNLLRLHPIGFLFNFI